jgi:hypothetical protein
MAVCEYCRCIVGKDANADTVKDLGKISQVVEDLSAIQLGSQGQFKDTRFTVVGRIQLRYERGMWNEWYLYFDDGSAGWLTDAGGIHLLSLPLGPCAGAPSFEGLAPLTPWVYAGQHWTVTDIREAQCIAGQGELPFTVGDGWPAQVVDFRSGEFFLTLDFSESGPPQTYRGQAMSTAELALSHLRDVCDLSNPAGLYKGKVQALDCPACGAALTFRPGVAVHVVCGGCQASVDCSSERAVVLEASRKLEQFEDDAVLRLGTKGRLGGEICEVIGFVQRGVPGSPVSEHWMEYLLMGPDALLWLVYSQGAWSSYRAVKDWPRIGAQSLRVGTRSYRLDEAYTARVMHAVGAFNWRVHVGDECQIKEFSNGEELLTLEVDAHEVGCSSGCEMSAQSIAEAFNLEPGAAPTLQDVDSGVASTASQEFQGRQTPDPSLPLYATFIFFFLIAWMVHGGSASMGRALLVFLGVGALLWLPYPWMPPRRHGTTSDDDGDDGDRD